LATAMALSMVSLAGIPPLAGFFGKFLLLKSIIERGASLHAYYWLAAIAIGGVVISLYYYFGVVRTIYWSKDVSDPSPVSVPLTTKLALVGCMVGMLFVGIYPQPLLTMANQATEALNQLNVSDRAVA